MGVKVYYSEISAHKEVKKRQQKVMMILESKIIPYEAIDITEAGRESDKDFMLKTAKPRGDSKFVLSPQIFNEEVYCGDYDDFELANENDELEKFLNVAKRESNATPFTNGNQNGTVNGTSRGSSAEVEAKVEEMNANNAEATPTASEDNPPAEQVEAISTTEVVPEPSAKEEGLEEIEPQIQDEEEEEIEEE